MQKDFPVAVTHGTIEKRRLHRQFLFLSLDWCYIMQLASSFNYKLILIIFLLMTPNVYPDPSLGNEMKSVSQFCIVMKVGKVAKIRN